VSASDSSEEARRVRDPGQGDADAGRDHDLLAAHGERGGQAGGHPLGQADRVALVGQVGAEHGELVAAEAREGVARAQDAAQPPGHGDQQPVDGVVAEPLAHLPEPVQVEHEHGQGGLATQAGQLVLGVAALAQVDQLPDEVAGRPEASRCGGSPWGLVTSQVLQSTEIASPSTRRQRCWSW
jgi:hypothetical protein